MANSGFVVINTVHNNGHRESVLLVSSLSPFFWLWPPYLLRYTQKPQMAEGKLSFLAMLTGEYHIELVIY